VKIKLLGSHVAERVSCFPLVMFHDPAAIIPSYMSMSVASAFTGGLINFVIYALFNEEEGREVTASRNIAFNTTSVAGLAIALIVTAAPVAENKFVLLFTLGVVAGLVSPISVSMLGFSRLRGFVGSVRLESPERVMAVSLFLLSLLVYGNFLGVVWIPFLVNVLGAPEYFAVAVMLITTVTSIAASALWRGRSYKGFRTALAATTTVPLLALSSPTYTFHIAVATLHGVMFTGANFLGNILLARYSRWFGAVKSGIIL